MSATILPHAAIRTTQRRPLGPGPVRFDGRITEDFKLATGTWVSVGPLRTRLVGALAPFVKDAVIAAPPIATC